MATYLYVGNFHPPFSTENYLRQSLSDNPNTTVILAQEDEVNWATRVEMCMDHHADVFLWTRTSSLDNYNHLDAYRSLAILHANNIPTVSYHLDLFLGLPRESIVATNPFFRTEFVCTADGSHNREWATYRINHHTFYPAIHHREMAIGEAREEWVCDVGFVGNWDSYHPEYPGRRELIEYLRNRYGERFRAFPEPGSPAIRGMPDLNDLYASIKVVVGDSCFGGTLDGYWSDRAPETFGRYGALLMPTSPKFNQEFPHALTYADYSELDFLIEILLQDDRKREEYKRQNYTLVDYRHTYMHRILQLEELLRDRGYLANERMGS